MSTSSCYCSNFTEKKQALLMTKLSPEHGDNKIDQQKIGEQHIYSCYSLNRPILL